MSSVSVVLVSYHTGPILFHALASVLNQENVHQAILVDNGNPESDLNELSRRFSPDPRFVLLTGQGNIGFSKGCNLGTKSATGEILLFLNPDCIVPRNAINGLLEKALTLHGDWILAPRLVNPDRTEQRGARREILTPWMAFVEGTKLYKIFPNHPYFKRFNNHAKDCPDEIVEIPVTSGACMMMPRSSYNSINGMDESYFLHVEDIDFCLRFRQAGGKIYFCPHFTFVHVLGTSNVSKLFVEWHKLISFRHYFRVHFTGVYPLGFISLVNFLITVKFVIFAVKELPHALIRLLRLQKPDAITAVTTDPDYFNQNKTQAENDVAYNSTPAGHSSNHISSPDSSS